MVTKGPVELVGEVIEFEIDEDGVGVGAMLPAATVGARGSVSKDRVRRQLARKREKLVGITGSCVEV